MVASQLNRKIYLIAEAPSNPLLTLPFNYKITSSLRSQTELKI